MSEPHASHLLAFGRWRLDYCDMAFVVPESRTKNMTAVLQLLEAVTEAEAAQKRASCARAAPVLSYTHDDSPQRPGAATHILSELCQMAKGEALRPQPLDMRCLLLPPSTAYVDQG